MSDKMFKWLNDFHAQVRDAAERGEAWDLGSLRSPENVVFLGIGGSAIGATLVYDLFHGQFKCPVTVTRGDLPPAWLGKKSLAVAVSYSGETRETVEAFRQILNAGAQVAGISSGGTLASIAEEKGTPHLLIPPGMAPRAALAYTSLPLVYLLKKAGVISKEDPDIEGLVRHLENLRLEWGDRTGPGPGVAQRISRRLPLIFGGGLTTGAARRFQAQLAENAKVLSICLEVPEALHNLVETLEIRSVEPLRPIAIFLEDPWAPESSRRIFAQLREYMLETGIEVIPIYAEEEAPLTRLYSLVHKIDWISYHLARLKGVDPIAIPVITTLKEKLSN